MCLMEEKKTLEVGDLVLAHTPLGFEFFVALAGSVDLLLHGLDLGAQRVLCSILVKRGLLQLLVQRLYFALVVLHVGLVFLHDTLTSGKEGE